MSFVKLCKDDDDDVDESKPLNYTTDSIWRKTTKTRIILVKLTMSYCCARFD